MGVTKVDECIQELELLLAFLEEAETSNCPCDESFGLLPGSSWLFRAASVK